MANYSIDLGPLGSIDPVRYFHGIAEVLIASLSSTSPNPYPALTFVGAVIVTAKIAIIFFRKERQLGISDVVIVIASWAGYECAKQGVTYDILSQASEEMRRQMEQLQSQLDEEKRLTNTQKEQIEKLQETSAALEKRAPELQEAANAHTQANESHASLLADGRSLIEQEKLELARVEGFLEAYREELRELEEEVEASERNKREIKDEIASLLDQQRQMNTSLSQKVEQLRQIEARLKEKGT